MNDLEKYFNIIYKDIDFKKITDTEKIWIERSADFNIWRMNQAMELCGKAICNVMKKTVEVIRYLNIFESTYHRTIKK